MANGCTIALNVSHASKTRITNVYIFQEEWFDNWHQNKSHGVCFCIVYHVWSDRDMECWHPEAPAIPPPWAIAIGVGIALLLIVKLAILLKLMV